MDDPLDQPLTDLDQIASLQNLDTARMSLRWALERLHALEARIADLTEQLRLSELVREKSQRENEGLKELQESAPATEPERRRLAASMEEYVLLSLAGKLDLAPLLARELKAMRLRSELEAEKSRQDSESAARRETLEKEFETRRSELDATHEERSHRLLDEARQRQDVLGEELSRRSQALLDAEENLQKRERELAVRQALLEERQTADQERAEASLRERRSELEREQQARRVREEEDYAQRAAAALTAWDKEREEHRREIQKLESAVAQLNSEARSLREENDILDASARRAEEAFARETTRHESTLAHREAAEQQVQQTLRDQLALQEKEKTALIAKLSESEHAAAAALDRMSGLEATVERLGREAVAAAEQTAKDRTAREEELAQEEENRRGHLEWLEQCLEEAKAAAVPVIPAVPAPQHPRHEEWLALQDRLRVVESAAEKSRELLEREQVWREDMTHTWDILISQAKSVWLSDQEKENLAKEFKIKVLTLEKELAQAQEELARQAENHSQDLNRLRESESERRSLVDRERTALFENARLRGDLLSWTNMGHALEERAASLEISLSGAQEDLRRTENNLRAVSEERQSAEARCDEARQALESLRKDSTASEQALSARLQVQSEELARMHDSLSLEIRLGEKLKIELDKTRASLEALAQKTKSSLDEDQLEAQKLRQEIVSLQERLTGAEASGRLSTQAEAALLQKYRAAETSISALNSEISRLQAELDRPKPPPPEDARVKELSALCDASKAEIARLQAELDRPKPPPPEDARVKELSAALAVETQRRKKLEDFLSAQKGDGPTSRA